jgi:hypothetical protein
MKNSTSWILLAIAIFLLWLTNCKGEDKTVPKTIKTKEIKVKVSAVKPESKTITKPIINAEEVKKIFPQKLNNEEVVFYENQINKLLQENQVIADSFRVAKDSNRLAMYKKSNQINAFTHTWDKEYFKATVNGLTRGEIQSIELECNLKERNIEVPKEKRVAFRLLFGGEIGINKELNQLLYKLGFGLQNRKGDIIRGGFQKIGNQEYYMVGFDKSIFTIKRK